MNTIKESIVKKLKKLIWYLEERLYQRKTEFPSPINSLSPKILTEEEDLKRIHPYLKNLKGAIDSDGVNNIAITGSYGSGKSTILKTFQHLNPEYEYLSISLASFVENERKPEDSEFERRLEVSILQQMFYHVEPSEIPDSRFKRIINLSTKKLFFPSTFLILWSFSTLILFKFNQIEKLNPEGWTAENSIDWITLLTSIVFFIGIGLFVKNLYRIFKNSKINKLSIKGELELGESIDKSVFNQHLEEILYFFERTAYNVVLIEDVDRFNSTSIFTKLREINILINKSKLIRRPVKFVYAVKDEMFQDKNERVKFFEFIIPVIPFINPSNANDQLTKLITHANLQDVLSADFTSDVVTFIDDIDMRLLINIFQEYQLYSTLLSSDLIQDKLFSIIVYKNLYPADYGELQKRNGILYDFFSNKPNYIKDLTNQYKDRIKEISSRIEQLEGEANNSIKELRAVYINKIISRLDKFHAFNINGDHVSVEEILEDENFKQIECSKSIGYTYYSARRSRSYHNEYDIIPSNVVQTDFNFSELEKESSVKLTYKQREKIIIERNSNGISTLKSEKEKLRQKINSIGSMSIKELFEVVNPDKHLGCFAGSNLMRNLLLNGYIDEHYDDYITLFHGVTLTKEDFTFERNVKSGHILPFDHTITKFEPLIKRLPEHYFKRESILNYDLMSFLIDNTHRYRKNVEHLFQYLSDDGDKQFEFIYGYIKTNPTNIDIFIETLCNYKPNLCKYILKNSMLPEDEIRNLIRIIFNYARLDSILKFEDCNYLEAYLSQMNDLFLFCSTLKQTDTIESFIANRGIIFESLDTPSEHQRHIFEYIHDKNLYILNEHNILSIIKGGSNEVEKKELNSSHYTTLLKLDMKNLLNYINDNIEEYIENVMLAIEDNKEEDEETVIRIVNREDVDLALKEKVITSQNANISLISSINDFEAKQIVLKNNKLIPHWSNIFDYYKAIEHIDFDETLIKFLNTEANYLTLCKSSLNIKGVDSETVEQVSENLLHCNKLDFDAYAFLISSIPFQYTRLNLEKLDEDKIHELLRENLICLSSDNFNGLKLKENKLHIKLIEIYQDLFIETLDELELDTDDYLSVLQSSGISDSVKLSFIQQIEDNIIIKNRSIAHEVGLILPENRTIDICYEVLAAIFDTRISRPKKTSLLNLYFDRLDNIQIQGLIEKLGEDYKKIFRKRHKPTFPKDSHHITLFGHLQKKGLIIRFEAKDGENEIKVFANYQ